MPTLSGRGDWWSGLIPISSAPGFACKISCCMSSICLFDRVDINFHILMVHILVVLTSMMTLKLNCLDFNWSFGALMWDIRLITFLTRKSGTQSWLETTCTTSYITIWLGRTQSHSVLERRKVQSAWYNQDKKEISSNSNCFFFYWLFFNCDVLTHGLCIVAEIDVDQFSIDSNIVSMWNWVLSVERNSFFSFFWTAWRILGYLGNLSDLEQLIGHACLRVGR